MHKDQVVKDLLEDLVSGVRNPICNGCWQMEDVNTMSMRQQRLKNKTEEVLQTEIKNNKIKHLVIDSGTQCNFACRTCGPWSSTGHYKEWETRTGKPFNENKIISTDVNSLLELDLSTVESVEVLGGEPFTNLEHLEVIKKINESNASAKCSLSYSTNGSVKLRPEILDTFNKFQSVNISLSIDAIGKEFNYIRTLGKWEVIVKNVETLQQLKKTYKNLSVSAHPTISALNILTIDKLFNWFNSKQIPFALVFCTVREYSMEVFNNQQKQQIIDQLELNPTDIKKQIIKHIQNTEFVEQSLTTFKKAIKFTEEYRKLSLKEYLPKLYEFI
jgi:sulfatase maturation enzyme AslB (radical SAM superfamily)